MNFFFFCCGLGAILFLSCRGDELNENFNLEWRSMYPTEVLATSMNPIVLEQVVVYSNDFITGDDFLIAYNKKSGKEIWRIDDDRLPEYDASASYVVIGEKIFIVNDNIIACISAEGGLVWVNSPSVLELNKIFLHVNIIYCTGDKNESGLIVEIDESNGQIHEIINYQIDGKREYITNAYFFKKNNLNHLLTSVYYSDDDQGESIDSLYLYDLEDNSLVWSLDAIPGIVTNNFQFKGDFLFTLKDSLLWKYDFLNKEIIWEKRINQSTRIQTKILDNGIFFAETKSLGNKVTDLVKISIENGQELWRKPFNYPLNEVTFYQDFFYLIHKGICQKRSVYSGEVVREFFNPDDLDMTGGSFDDAFGIDTVTKNIYTADYSSALKYRNVD